MKKTDYINSYNRKNYKKICLLLKPAEKEKLDKILIKYGISLRKYLLIKMEDERGD